MTDRIRLGRALVRNPGPLVERDGRGELQAILPLADGYPPGVLIVGSTRGGKTNLLRYMVTGLLSQPGPKGITLADGKGAHSFMMFAHQPGIIAIEAAPDPASGEPDPIPDLVRGFHGQVQARYDQFKKAKEQAFYDRGPLRWRPPGRLVFVLDEFMDWILGQPPKLRMEMNLRLTRCGQIGGEVNCRLWLAMQAPYAKAVGDVGLPGPLKMQLKARIAATGMLGMDDVEAGMYGDHDAGHRIERAGDEFGLHGEARKGLGMLRIARVERPFKAPPMHDPLHWQTTPEQAEAAWRMLPYRPTSAELQRLREAA